MSDKLREVRSARVCVVGGAGFLGSHLVHHLAKERNCAVTVVDNLCVGLKKHLPPNVDFVHHDITGSEEFLTKMFQRQRIHYVFNYAAWPYIPDSFSRPVHVANVNFMGAIKVINAAQDAGCLGVLQVSSAEIYGEGGRNSDNPLEEFRSGKLDELDEVCPHSTYGVAKAAVDYYCQSAWKERQTKVMALRQFNCVGERETHPYVIPEIISQLHAHATHAHAPKVLLGNNSVRDFLHARDAVRMAVELMEYGTFGEVYNLGSETAVSIYDLARMIGRLMGFNEVNICTDSKRVRPWEIWHLQSDNTKIHATIPSRPTVTLEQALKATLTYFQENGNRWDW